MKSCKALIIDPFSGAGGDMLIASLLDIGISVEELEKSLHYIPALSKAGIKVTNVRRGAINASRLLIDLPSETKHRSLSDIVGMLKQAALQELVKHQAIDTFERLAKAEAKVHGCSIEEVHFHEVGALDAILDVVGWFVCLEILGRPQCYLRKIVLGCGITECQHGTIPVPAPATLELLIGFELAFSNRDEELLTPTAAAILAASCRPIEEEMSFVLEKIGYGAGSRDSDLPNVVRVILGSIEKKRGHVCVITSTIDDMNPEIYGFLMEKLLGIGALEVYFNPVVMKKNRPGLEITVICEETDAEKLGALILRDTTTIGLRVRREERIELERRQEEIDTPYGKVIVKVARMPGGGEKASPEYESCRSIAEAREIRILEVFEAALEAWKNQGKK